MNTIILPTPSHRRARTVESAAQSAAFRSPHYQCEMLDDALKLVVYVPGVDAAGVEIATRGPDLTVTARKRQIVRVNWQALHLERAQRPYQLHLRLGRGLDYSALSAELRDGVLTIILPKKQAGVTDAGVSTRRVA
jgi:HSP20 family protein